MGYWKMDEASWAGVANEVVDSSGNADHGTAAGGATKAITTSTAKFGLAGSFDGTDDYVSGANISTSTLTGLTYSFWMKTSANNSNGILLHWANKFCRIGGVTVNKVNCTVDGSSGGSAVSTSNINDGLWHFISYTSFGNSQKIYFDGVQQGTATEIFSADTGGIFTIGIRHCPNRRILFQRAN